ncbi:MAG: beta-ketoacyl-[acyl-carrier-protein] synthase family protein [Amylibacter sp.]|nr:beta-ketoacyl-[acyl-carrier-protein] synthase family protein [Amylibacter sp.]
MNRVVITGQGTINALGKNVAETLDAMSNGVCGIGPLEFDNVDRLNIKIGGQIKGYTAQDHFTRSEIALYDPFTQFAVIAAQEAIAQSGLGFSDALAENTGVVLGTAGGGLQTQDQNFRSVYEDGKNRVHPFVVPRLMNNAAASHISMIHGLRGPSFTVASACASSNHAMGQAYHMIRSGMAQIMVTGGSESMLCFGGIKAWEALRVMSPDGCRPFCATRNGMVQGEGAAVFVFEDYQHAKARGADILAEVIGFAMTSDASDIVMPSQTGAARAIRLALKDAGVNAGDVGYINAHGTATTANDKTECAAIRDVLGGAADAVMISSTKAMHGHLMGGTGAVELLAVIAAVKDAMIAPTVNHTRPDPACDLDVVPNTARHSQVKVAISNAFAFGGLNAVLVLKSP